MTNSTQAVADELPVDFASLRYLNETAIREHALDCSRKFRCNKFTRVGQDFIDEVNADVERIVRELRGRFPTLHDAVEPTENTSCATGLFRDKLMREMNRLIARIIQNAVQRQPSCGKTLRRTR